MVFSAEKEGDTKDVGRMQPPEKKDREVGGVHGAGPTQTRESDPLILSVALTFFR